MVAVVHVLSILPHFLKHAAFSFLFLRRELSCAGFNLAGTIPQFLSHLTALTVLDLSSNRLSSVIPSDILTLPSLLVVNLSNNYLSGSLPVLELSESQRSLR